MLQACWKNGGLLRETALRFYTLLHKQFATSNINVQNILHYLTVRLRVDFWLSIG
jgi:hypothetical protein